MCKHKGSILTLVLTAVLLSGCFLSCLSAVRLPGPISNANLSV